MVVEPPEEHVFGQLHVSELYGQTPLAIDKSIPVQKERKITIGRSEGNSIIIKHPSISGVHCVIWAIQFDNDSIPLTYVKDVSLNGTFVNGIGLHKNQVHLLSHGDVVLIQNGIALEYSSPFEENEGALGDMLIDENHIVTSFQNWSVKSRVLGNGTFGHVLVSERKFDSKLCAVKVVKNSSDVVPFEAKMLLNLYHPNVIRVHEAQTIGNKLYIFEELICGGDLFSYLANGSSLKAIPEFEALVISFQILSALKYLHKNNVVHRDLKLDNVLLEAPEPFTRIVLADFGIAKSVSSTKRRMFTTVGTPEYCAPEVGFELTKVPVHMRTGILGHAPISKKGYDSKCDIWSLGIISHIMLSGISPFYEDGTEINIIKSAKKGKLKFQLKQWHNVSSAAMDFVQSLLYVDIQKRLSIEEAVNHHWLLKHDDELKIVYQKILDSSSIDS